MNTKQLLIMALSLLTASFAYADNHCIEDAPDQIKTIIESRIEKMKERGGERHQRFKNIFESGQITGRINRIIAKMNSNGDSCLTQQEFESYLEKVRGHQHRPF